MTMTCQQTFSGSNNNLLGILSLELKNMNNIHVGVYPDLQDPVLVKIVNSFYTEKNLIKIL